MKLYKHPAYVENFDLWTKLYDCYKGDHDTMVQGQYLILDEHEKTAGDGQSLRTNRELRTRYLAIPEMVVSIWLSTFMRQEPQYDEEVTALFEKVKDADKDIDGKGTSLIQFIKQILESYFVYGKATVHTDNLSIEPINKTAEKAAGMRPYMTLISPLSAVDWSLSNDNTGRIGKFNFFRYNYCLIPERKRETDPVTKIEMSDAMYFNGSSYAVQRYKRQKSKDVIKKSKAKSPDIASTYEDGEWELDGAEIVTQLKDIPVVEICDESWLKDVNEESLRFHNLRSAYDSILLHQCYQKIFAFGVDIGSAAQRSAITEYLIAMIESKDARVESIDPVDPHAIESAMEQSLVNCIKIALNQLRALPASSKAVEGGDTQSESKDQLYALVESTLTEVENCINQSLAYFAEFAGVSNFTGKISLNKEIDQDDTDLFMSLWGAFGSELSKYKTVKTEVLKKAAFKLNLPEDMIDEINKEIESSTEATQADAGIVADPNATPTGDNTAPAQDAGNTDQQPPASDTAQAA